MTIDPRLAHRRRQVAEDRARRNIGRLLKVLVVVALVGGGVWLLLSPPFSVRVLDVDGVQSSATADILTDNRVVMGRPLVLIRPGEVQDELLTDPWIRRAEVSLDWPDRVLVSIEERTPAAWVETASGWGRRSVDGVALPGPDRPDDTMGHISLPRLPGDPISEDPSLLGALEFLDSLPVALGSDAVVEERAGELWAVVSGHQVRLGRPVDMSDKALSLAALLAEGLEPGTEINMIAPTNPATTGPDSDQESQKGTDDGGEAFGEAGENDPEEEP